MTTLAEAWDEGYCAGFDNGADAANRKPTTRHDNPYRDKPQPPARADHDTRNPATDEEPQP